MTTECPTCGRDDFSSEMGMKQHHARAHGESIAGKLVSCDICNKSYRIRPSNKGERNLCSNECVGKWMSNIDSEEHWNYNGGKSTLTCEQCGEEYKVNPSKVERSKYCSAECRDSAKTEISGEEHPLYDRETLICEQCGEEYSTKQYRSDSSRFCSAGCRHRWLSIRTGEGHPLYEGGQHNLYKQRDWRIFSEKYRNWVGECESCGSSEKLQTHHDEPISMGGDLYDNTFTVLCSECHYGEYERWHPPQLEEYIKQNS